MMLVYLFHADLWANAVLGTNENGGKRNASAPRGGGRRSSEIGAPHTFCSPATRAHACSRHKTAELVSPRGPSEPSQQDFSVHLAYIDCSNLFIKAQKVSAMVQGWTRSLAEVSLQLPARLAFPVALPWEVEDPLQVTVFGSGTDSNGALWQLAKATGFEVGVVERTAFGNRIDTGEVAWICRDTYLLRQPGRERITLVAGGGDYKPMVRQLVEDGFEVTLLHWSHASRELQEVASHVYPFDAYLNDLLH